MDYQGCRPVQTVLQRQVEAGSAHKQGQNTLYRRETKQCQESNQNSTPMLYPHCYCIGGAHPRYCTEQVYISKGPLQSGLG